MIIGIDASRANKKHKSGTEWYAYYLIRWLAKIDKENSYILYSDKPLEGGLLDLGSFQYFEGCSCNNEIKFDKRGYQIIKSPYNNFKGKVLKWPFPYFWTQGRLSWEMLWHSPDILFIPSHTLPFFYAKKSVVTIHDIGFETNNFLYPKEYIIKGKYKKIINLLVKIISGGKYEATYLDYLRWSTKYALKKAQKIITVSNFTENEIKKVYKLKRDNIFVVHNGYNKFLYKKILNKDKIREVLNKYDIDSPYFFYIGRLEKKKNIPYLIEAFALFKENNKNLNYKLVLVGDAGYCYDEINCLIHQYRLIDDVIMPGWIKEEDIPYLYNGAEAFIFPSLYEGFGIPLLQAMACEVPILASNIEPIKEVVKDAALLFDPKNINSITQAINKIIFDKQLKNNLTKKGAEIVKGYSWEKSAKETLKVLLKK